MRNGDENCFSLLAVTRMDQRGRSKVIINITIMPRHTSDRAKKENSRK